MADDFDIDAFIASSMPPKDTEARPREYPGSKKAEQITDAEAGITPHLDTRDAYYASGNRVPTDPSGTPVDGLTLRRTFPGVDDPGGKPSPWTNNPGESGDPIINAGFPLAVGILAGAAVPGAGVASKVFGGAATGGASTLAAGGSAKDVAEGAAIGAGAGALGAISPLVAGAAKRTSERLFQQIGRQVRGAGKAEVLSDLKDIGPVAVADVLKRNGIANVAQADAANAASQAALANTGKQMGAALDVIDTVPGKVTLGDAMTKFEELRKSMAANENTRKLADSLHGYMKDFWQANGGKASAEISASDLHGKVSSLERTGYGGSASTLEPGSRKELIRQTAGVLDDLLDGQVAKAAKTNPAAADAAKRLDALTKDYRILKTVQPIFQETAVAQRFAPSLPQRIADQGVAKAVVRPIAAAPIKVVGAARAGIDTMLAKLYSAPVVTPELAQEAIRSGVAPGTLQAIMSMRTAREATP